MDIVSYLLGKNSSGGGGGGSDLDWTVLGYSERPEAIDDGYNYALQIKNNWVSPTTMSTKFTDNYDIVYMPLVDTSNATSFASTFKNCYRLEKVPLLNTSNATNMQSTFYSCYGLTEVPLFDTSKVTSMNQMFYFCQNLKDVPQFDTSSFNSNNSFTNMFIGCVSLTDTSLNNILGMCINATSYAGTKTLQRLGFSDYNVFPVSRIQALPKYQDFIDAGWTIGY